MSIGVITVRVDRVYGKLTVYPVCEKAKLLAEIAGDKTLTHKTLGLAERLGFEILPTGLPLPKEERCPPGGSSDPYSPFYRGSDFS